MFLKLRSDVKIINEQIPSVIEETIEELKKKTNDMNIIDTFEKCLKNGYQTTIEYKQGKTFVLTGDIEAMWFRDSVMQMIPYLRMIDKSAEIQNMCRGMIEKHKEQFIIDVYANAFNYEGNRPEHRLKMENIGNSQQVWERKFELDSICLPLDFIYQYYKKTNDGSIFDSEFLEAMKIINQLLRIEQDHFKNSMYRFYRLENHGLGKPVKAVGLIWSSHRPSDDEQEYGYLIPSNLYLVTCIKQLAEIEEIHGYKMDDMQLIAKQIEQAIADFGYVDHPKYGRIYAYEVDGYGNSNLMDDANMPSLLSLPYLKVIEKENQIYINTRNFILSKDNRYYYQGKYASGVGSPHTHVDEVWPIAICMQYFSSQSQQERDKCFEMLLNTHNNTNLMHEAFNVNDPSVYSREWFGWANSMFIEVVFDKFDL